MKCCRPNRFDGTLFDFENGLEGLNLVKRRVCTKKVAKRRRQREEETTRLSNKSGCTVELLEMPYHLTTYKRNTHL